MIKEAAALYQAYTNAEESPLEELPIQYADYAAWQRRWLSGEVLEQQLRYWKNRLEGAAGVLELPADRPRPAVQSYRGSSVEVRVGREVTESLKALGRGEGATLFMVVMAAYKVLLYRLSGQGDISVGVPVANRNRAEVEGLIGFFVNTVVMRSRVRGEGSFLELLREEKEVAIGAHGHEDLPFEKLVEELQPERNLSHTPLFQVVFTFQTVPKEAVKLAGLTLSPMKVDRDTAHYDLNLNITDTEQGLIGALQYSSDLFDESTIARMAEHFEKILDVIIADPNLTLEEIAQELVEAEKQQWKETKIELQDASLQLLKKVKRKAQFVKHDQMEMIEDGKPTA